MTEIAADRIERAPALPAAGEHGAELSLGFLAMLPLFAAYEAALAADGSGRRSAAEALLGVGLVPLGEHARIARWIALGAASLVALAIVRARRQRVRAQIARIVLEGAAAALILGPLLVGALALLARWVGTLDVSWDASRSPPALAEAALVAGGAAWEELAFRVGLYSLLFLAVRRGAATLGASEGFGRWSAEAVGLLGSALCFAGFHFRALTGWLWDGGLEFSRASFAWLALAGVLLGLLFRWRGPGVAAWAHGLFNLALLVGIDPDVLQ
jgi:hypothetical protein